MDSILIAGSGAMACLFAARLSAAGIHVTLLDEWEEGLQTLAAHGVRLVNPDGAITSYPVHIARQPADCTPAQVALVLVKSWQTASTAHQLSGCLADDGLAVTLQNGLGNQEALQNVLGEPRVVLGVTTLGATLLEPGIVRPGGDGKIVLADSASASARRNALFRQTKLEQAKETNRLPLLGPDQSEIAPLRLSSAKDHHLLAMTMSLAEMLERVGFQVEFSDKPEALLWGKLVVNAAINPTTALLNIPNGEILANEASRQVMAAAAKEAAEVARARGIQLPFADPVEEAERVARQTASNHSSMLQDIRRGAPTEVDAICGAIVREGEVLGIPTPVNWTLFNLIKAKAERNA